MGVLEVPNGPLEYHGRHWVVIKGTYARRATPPPSPQSSRQTEGGLIGLPPEGGIGVTLTGRVGVLAHSEGPQVTVLGGTEENLFSLVPTAIEAIPADCFEDICLGGHEGGFLVSGGGIGSGQDRFPVKNRRPVAVVFERAGIFGTTLPGDIPCSGSAPCGTSAPGRID